jgi:hypothetical protein
MRAEDLRRSISQRATRLWLISLGKLSRAECEKAAARELAEEERQQQRASVLAPSQLASAEPNVHNARAVLLARINLVAERLRNAPVRRNRLPRQAAPPSVIRPHIEDPIAAQPAPVAAPATELQVIGVFAGRISTAELIPESEFDPRWQAQSQATNNWRSSIERNERIAARRRGVFIG